MLHTLYTGWGWKPGWSTEKMSVWATSRLCVWQGRHLLPSPSAFPDLCFWARHLTVHRCCICYLCAVKRNKMLQTAVLQSLKERNEITWTLNATAWNWYRRSFQLGRMICKKWYVRTRNYLNVHTKLKKLFNFSSTKHFYVVIWNHTYLSISVARVTL